MFTKWVAVARKSVLTIAFCVTRQDTADGDISGPKSIFVANFDFFLLTENATISRISKNDAERTGQK